MYRNIISRIVQVIAIVTLCGLFFLYSLTGYNLVSLIREDNPGNFWRPYINYVLLNMSFLSQDESLLFKQIDINVGFE